MISVTKLSHDFLLPAIQTGSVAIDLTAGNGWDTLFLAKHIGERGIVYAFDRQTAAIEATRMRLNQAGLLSRVRLKRACHANWPSFVDDNLLGVCAVVMNLGYLPGGDHTIRTEAASTIEAIHATIPWLRLGSRMSIVAYTGHEGGLAESVAIEAALSGLVADRFRVERTVSSPTIGAPVHYGLERV